MVPLVLVYRKSVRIPVTIRTTHNGSPVNLSMPAEVPQVGQISDMIIATIGLIRVLGISAQLLAECGYYNLTMNVVDGRSAKLTHCCTLMIRVLGVWRSAEAFVKPFDKGNEKDVHLFLGLIWLHNVDAGTLYGSPK